jgi:hypothetical protein
MTTYTTVPTASTATYTINVGSSGMAGMTGSVTVPSSYFYSSGSSNWASTNITANGSSNITGAGLHVTSDAEFEGNIKWKGRDLGKMLETIEKRLAILEPNPKKLKKFEALQKAYDHYKLLEALCHSEDDDE